MSKDSSLSRKKAWAMGEPAETKREWGRDGRNALAGEQEPDQATFREFRYFS